MDAGLGCCLGFFTVFSKKYRLKYIILNKLEIALDELDYDSFTAGIYKLRVYDNQPGGASQVLKFLKKHRISESVFTDETEFNMKFDKHYYKKYKKKLQEKNDIKAEILYELSVSRTYGLDL